MDNNTLVIWIFVGFDGLILLGVFIWFVWITWFDDRLRVCIFNSKYGVKFYKVKTKFDNMFTLDKGKYAIDKKAIYRRFNKIPYAFYFDNNPNPIHFEKQSKSKDISAVYTSQELHGILDTNMTMNLIKPKVDIKKLAMGTGILIGLAVILGLVLHFTGVIDLQTMFLTTNAVT